MALLFLLPTAGLSAEIYDVSAARLVTHVGSYTLDYTAAGIGSSKGCHNQSLKIGTSTIFSTCVASDGAYIFVHNLANPITYRCHVKRTDYGASNNTHVGGSWRIGNDDYLTVITEDTLTTSGKVKILRVDGNCGVTEQWSSTTWGDKAGMVIRASSSSANIQVWNYASSKYSSCSSTGTACGAKISVTNNLFDAQECMQSNSTLWSHVCSGLPLIHTQAKVVSIKFSSFLKNIPFVVSPYQLDYEGLDYQNPSGFPGARVWAASHAAPFASVGSCGLSLPCTDTSGRQWIHKFKLEN